MISERKSTQGKKSFEDTRALDFHEGLEAGWVFEDRSDDRKGLIWKDTSNPSTCRSRITRATVCLHDNLRRRHANVTCIVKRVCSEGGRRGKTRQMLKIVNREMGCENLFQMWVILSRNLLRNTHYWTYFPHDIFAKFIYLFIFQVNEWCNSQRKGRDSQGSEHIR